MTRTQHALTLVALFATLTGCARTDLYRQDGGRVRGELLASDEETVWLVDKNERVVSVPRSELRAVDYPGDALMITGGAVVAIYAPLMIAGLSINRGGGDEEDDGIGTALFSSGAMMGSIGLSLAALGLYQKRTARELLEGHPRGARAASRPTLTPTVVRDQRGRARPAAGLSFSF